MNEKISESVKIANTTKRQKSPTNINAVDKIDNEFANILKSKSNNNNDLFPTELTKIELPSRGIPYKSSKDENLKNGFVLIREIKGFDEKILLTQRYLKDGSALKRVLNNCIKSDIDVSDLCTIDFNYLLFALRQLSYGDEYEFKQKCENDMCQREINHKCKISEIKFNQLPEDFKEPIVIKLPKSKYIVEMILSRQYHVEEIKKLDLIKEKNLNDSDDTIINKYSLTTLKIYNEDGKEIPKEEYINFFEIVYAGDLAEIREKTSFNEMENQEITCPYCNRVQTIPIPMGASFFRLK